MTYHDLLRLYFDRSGALQWYWTVYVVVIGGLLAFASLRQRPDWKTFILVAILYVCFAYKNLGAIKDVTYERYAILTTMKTITPTPSETALKQNVEPTLIPPEYGGVRNFHVACDVLTIAALGTMELRRMRAARSSPPILNP
jgi:hypothetical protein